MQMSSVETKAARQSAARHRESLVSIPFASQVALDVLNFHGGVVYKTPTASARPPKRHDVEGFADGAQQEMDVRIESGIEIAMIKVLRQLPEKENHAAVRHAAVNPSLSTPSIAARTNSD